MEKRLLSMFNQVPKDARQDSEAAIQLFQKTEIFFSFQFKWLKMPQGCCCVDELNSEASEPCGEVLNHQLKFPFAHVVSWNVLDLSQGEPALQNGRRIRLLL